MINDLIPYGNRAMIPYILGNENLVSSESPETAVARTDSSEASRLLKQLSKDSVSKCALDSASKIVHDYLSEVPQERLENSNGVKVSFERKHRFFSEIEDGFTYSRYYLSFIVLYQ